MTRYVIRRMLLLVPTVLAIVTIAFFAMHLAPGDATDTLLLQDRTPQEAALLRHQYGIDRPILLQYGSWLWGILHGNLGTSYATGQPIASVLGSLFAPTIELIVLGLVLSLVIAVPLGVLAAKHEGRLADHLSRLLAMTGVSVPTFWLGLLLVLAFSVHLHIFPSVGYVAFSADPASNLMHMALPTITLGAALAGVELRTLRASMVDSLRSEYVRTAIAKGVPSHLVVNKHALRNALIPGITIVGLQIGYLIGGTVILSQVFSLPGLGQLLLEGVNQRDYPVVQAMILIYGGGFALINLIVDVVYSLVDPRVRHT